MNEYEQLIQPKEIVAKNPFLKQIAERIRKLYYGNEKHRKKMKDGRISYIDNNGRLVISSVLEGNVIQREIYPSYLKSGEPAIEIIERDNSEFSKGKREFAYKEKRSYFASRKDFEMYQEWIKGDTILDTAEFSLEIDKDFGEGPRYTAEIAYAKDGGYEMDLRNNNDTINLQDGTLVAVKSVSHIVSEPYERFQDCLTARPNAITMGTTRIPPQQLIKKTIDTQYVKEAGVPFATSRETKITEKISGIKRVEDYDFEAVDGSNSHVRNIAWNDSARGSYSAINGKVDCATGCYQVTFQEQNGEVVRLPQKSYEEILVDYHNYSSQIEYEEIDKYTNPNNRDFYKLEVEHRGGFGRNQATIVMESTEGKGRYANTTTDRDRLRRVFLDIMQEANIDVNEDDVGVAGWGTRADGYKNTLSDCDFSSPFTGRTSRDRLSSIVVQNLKFSKHRNNESKKNLPAGAEKEQPDKDNNNKEQHDKDNNNGDIEMLL